MKPHYTKKWHQALAATKKSLMRSGKIVKKYIDKKGKTALVYRVIGQK